MLSKCFHAHISPAYMQLNDSFKPPCGSGNADIEILLSDKQRGNNAIQVTRYREEQRFVSTR